MDKVQDPKSTRIMSQARTIMRIDLATISHWRTLADGNRHILRGSVRGWAVCSEPLTRIDVLLGGRFVATARLGDARPDIAALFPDINHAGQTGFEASLESGRLPQDVRNVVLRLYTAAGRKLTITHPLTIVTGSAAADHPPIKLAIEECVIAADGQLHVSGWALAKAPIAAIQIFVGDDHLATTMPSRERPDIAALLPGYANSLLCGFAIVRSMSRSVQAALEPIRVEVVARDGGTREMIVRARVERALVPTPARQHRQHRQAPAPRDLELQFHCDSIALAPGGAISIEGWAAARVGISSISVELDGAPLGEARLGLPRPDVARAYPQLPGSRNAGFGFDGVVSGPLLGEHAIDLTVCLRDGSRHGFLEMALASDASTTTDGDTSTIMLAVDGMQISDGHAARLIDGPFHLVGWAAARAGIADVEVFIDETSLGHAHHGLRRADVAAALPQFPNALLAGFALSIPARALKQGRVQFRVAVTARDAAQTETRFSADIDLSARKSAAPRLRKRIAAAELWTHQAILAARGPLPICELALRVPAGRKSEQAALATLASLGSGLVDQSQKMTAAAMQIAEKNVWAQRS